MLVNGTAFGKARFGYQRNFYDFLGHLRIGRYECD
jgi:hypothetical protein